MSPTRLMRILTILAVFLAPLGMIGGASAEARAPAPSTNIHQARAMAGMDCAGLETGEGKSQPQPAGQHDCMMACAAIPSFASELPAKLPVARAVEPVLLSTSGSGLKPEAATPPPRFA